VSSLTLVELHPYRGLVLCVYFPWSIGGMSSAACSLPSSTVVDGVLEVGVAVVVGSW
jgi:hypothetical protein